MSFGKNLGYYRKKMNITQEELAERLYVSRQTISRWENDSVLPDLEMIIKLCELFDCDMDTLVRGDPEAKESAAAGEEIAASASENEGQLKNKRRRSGMALNSKISSVTMLSAAVVYCILGFGFGLWNYAWISFAVGALICGVSSIITMT